MNHNDGALHLSHSLLHSRILKTSKRVTGNTSIRYMIHDATCIWEVRDMLYRSFIINDHSKKGWNECFASYLQFSKQRFVREGVNGNVHKILNLDNDEKGGSAGHKGRRSRISRMATSVDVNGVEQSKMQFDSTGMFHWCPSRELGSCLMDRQEAAMTVLQVGQGFQLRTICARHKPVSCNSRFIFLYVQYMWAWA